MMLHRTMPRTRPQVTSPRRPKALREPDVVTPPIGLSVVVPTRNRPEHVVDCAKSLIECDAFDELRLRRPERRQPDGDVIENIGDARIRCVRSELRGATNGRNLGIELTSGSMIAFTDDDCRVAPDWAERIREVFESDPEVAVVCGRVQVPDRTGRKRFRDELRATCPRVAGPLSTARSRLGHHGEPRRPQVDTLERVGNFDPFLGPGAPLLCGEEPDSAVSCARCRLQGDQRHGGRGHSPRHPRQRGGVAYICGTSTAPAPLPPCSNTSAWATREPCDSGCNT